MNKIRIFKHKTHTVCQIRPYSEMKPGIVVIHNTTSRLSFKTLLKSRRKFLIHMAKNCLFIHIMLPCFYLDKNVGGIKIGLPNLYLWVIK